MSHESNGLEHAQSCVARALNTGPLYICHRLDLWTTGVLVMARNKAATTAFMRSLQARQGTEEGSGEGGVSASATVYQPEDTAIQSSIVASTSREEAGCGGGRAPSAVMPAGESSGTAGSGDRPAGVRKIYKALTCKAVPKGFHTHFMYDGPLGANLPVMAGGALANWGPRLLAGKSSLGWKKCLLKVIDCNEVFSASAHAWCSEQLKCDATRAGPSVPATLHEVTIRLVTGRSHQIRAQLSALDCPLVGDTLYRPLSGQLVTGASVSSEHRALVEAASRQDGPIGLHAWKMHWEDKSFVAPVPWHQDGSPV